MAVSSAVVAPGRIQSDSGQHRRLVVMQCQKAGCCLTDLTDTKCENEPLEADIAAGLDGGQKVAIVSP